MNRRDFARCCSGAMLLPAAAAWASTPMQDFARVRLTTADGVPLRAADVPADEALVFAYPYRGIPCYLLRVNKAQPLAHKELQSPDDGAYTSPAGVGPAQDLVAFAAICTHQLSYPTPGISQLRYAATGSDLAGSNGKIVCCAHGSVFDPADGGRQVGGPAQHPLAPVRLEHDAASDALYATGAVGEQFFQRFFAAYKSDLIERYGPGQYRAEVGDSTSAVPLGAYSKRVVTC